MLPAVFSRLVRQKLNYKQVKNKIMDFETLGDWCKWFIFRIFALWKIEN